MTTTVTKSKKIFDVTSLGFQYSIIVAVLTIFAALGVSFPKEVTVLGLEISTALSTGGVYAILAVFVGSVLFPLIYWWKNRGTVDFWGVFGKTSVILALGNALFSGLALFGIVLPDGTFEQIVGAIKTQSWNTLIDIFLVSVLPIIVRLIKKIRGE